LYTHREARRVYIPGYTHTGKLKRPLRTLKRLSGPWEAREASQDLKDCDREAKEASQDLKDCYIPQGG